MPDASPIGSTPGGQATFPLAVDGRTRRRGQVGIGTLLVFLGLVLTAALAGSVLISTGDSLARQGQATAEESAEKVSTDLLPVRTTGRLDDGPTGVKNITTTIRLAPGSGEIDLRDATVSLSTSDGEFVRSDGASRQGIEILENPVLSNDEETTAVKARIRFHFDDGSTGIETDGGVLYPGTDVLIRITTRSGAKVDVALKVDRPLDPRYTGGERIRLH